MWRQLIDSKSDACAFRLPALEAEIAHTESALGITLPAELRSLLAESNGVSDHYGGGLIWSAEQIKRVNLEFRETASFRELYMSFESLLFFADAGDGNQFAYPIRAGEVRCPDIFVWEHETDSRRWYASSLESYVTQRIAGGD